MNSGITNTELFNCVRLPGRLLAEPTAQILGFQNHDLPILVNAGLLKPLGKPAHNSPRYFAASDVVQRASDSEWLDRATRAVAAYWKRKNQKRPPKPGEPEFAGSGNHNSTFQKL